jgi:putative (di)nucleoside polyphosphate hydrolase
VFGADHHGYIPRLKAAARGLGEDPERLRFQLVQFAVLYRGGQKVQMSTRSGEFVTLRELREEVGLEARHVELLGRTRRWLRYRLPEHYQRRDSKPLCIGQKQRWYLLRFLGSEADFSLDACETPEFDQWRWVDYWTPAREVIFFKRDVYRRALGELEPLLGSVAGGTDGNS